MTMAWQRASRSGGTRPRWRTSRPEIVIEGSFMLFVFLQKLLIQFGPVPGFRKGLPRTPLGHAVTSGFERRQKCRLPLVNVGGELRLPIANQLRHRESW